MNKSKYFAFILMITTIMLLILGNWVTPVQANNAGNGTPTPTGIPVFVTGLPGRIPSAKEQNNLKAAIQGYIETRYRALSVSDAKDFKQNGFGNLVSDTHEARVFLREEKGKLAVQVKHAELDHLRGTMLTSKQRSKK